MSYAAGRLDKRVTLQSAVLVRDGHGQPIETWSNVATVWAAIEPIRGREFFAAKQFSAEVTHKLVIRYRSGV
ncbi:MAG: head-tail adaptor protein, partial [Deltaproteobacteria bacterium]|nr:head-tail adaptor protein [Deltaproteobacteria bacterium]